MNATETKPTAKPGITRRPDGNYYMEKDDFDHLDDNLNELEQQWKQHMEYERRNQRKGAA